MDTNGNAYLADFGFLPIVLEFRTAPYLSTAIGSSVRWAAPELFEFPTPLMGLHFNCPCKVTYIRLVV
jgi:hypothetical protein